MSTILEIKFVKSVIASYIEKWRSILFCQEAQNGPIEIKSELCKLILYICITFSVKNILFQWGPLFEINLFKVVIFDDIFKQLFLNNNFNHIF